MACENVRPISDHSPPNRADALCLLSILDGINSSQDHVFSPAELVQASRSAGRAPGESAALARLGDNTDNVGHRLQPESTSVPLIGPGGALIYIPMQLNLFGVDRADVRKLAGQ
jgi:hypothetical protein